jgi:hypothetical protein
MSRLVRTILAGVGAVVISAATSLAVATPAAAATYYRVVNSKSGKCMSVEGGGSTANGANVIQWTCNGGGEQLWYWSGSRLKNFKSGKCLSVAGGGSTANGAEIIQWSCNGGPEQNWHMSGASLFNDNSYKVASVEGGSTANGAKVKQWDYFGTGDEADWYFYEGVIDA